jgi:nucleotide-binding universal stress UspA family protein
VPKGRYLVGIDFSTDSRRALDAARTLARRTGASLTLVHVRPFSDIRAAVVEERGDLVRAGGRVLSRELVAHYVKRLSAWARESEGDRTLVLRGAPDLALAREARRGYALLVLGRRGRNTVSSLFVGSTAERVLSRATIPTLVVPGRRR